jgi:hypothetical protein
MQKAALILLIFATALLIWMPRQVRIENARNDVTALKFRQATLEEQIAAAETSLDSRRGALQAERSTFVRTLAALSAAQFEPAIEAAAGRAPRARAGRRRGHR